MVVLEFIGVAFALVYLFGAAFKKWWCWPAGVISSIIYLFICIRVKLYPESVLQFFYIAMGFYGWYKWVMKSEKKFNSTYNSIFTNIFHSIILFIISIALALLLKEYTDAALPYLDSPIAVFSIYATWLTARKKNESWIYWFFINLSSIILFWQRDLKFTSALYVVYCLVGIYGFINWSNKNIK